MALLSAPSLAGAALAAALLSWLVVLGVRRYSAGGGLMDVPNERSSHTRATPRGGGLGIVLVTLGGALLADRGPAVLAWVAAGGLIAAVSWVDDLRTLSNRARFGAHLAASLLVMAAGGWIGEIEVPFVGSIDLGWLGAPLTLLWLVGMTNLYNFMDGIDGIAGIQAVVAGAGWLLLGLAAGIPVVAWVGLLAAASSAGFLRHNWSPAKIFMGDVGSAFLGFTFAWLGVVAVRGEPALAPAMVLLVWPFLFDGSVTLLRRLARGENIFSAHRSHLYQRLVIAGQPHSRVAALYGLLGAAGVLVAWLWATRGEWGGMAVIFALATALVAATERVARRPPASRE